ncbi:hypothetical protein KAR91_03175 [Candidatus Pacearchaeota archaeon]|nr:hypothetical protein [Candidatus Pacearchaeota archaeon]
MRFTFDLDPEEGFSTDQFLDAIFPDKDDFLVELGAIAVFGGVSRAGFVLADKLSGQGMPKQEIEQVLDSMTELQKEKKLEDILAFETDVQTEEFDAESARIKQEAVDAGIEEEVAQNFVDTINARVIAMADSMQIPRADIVKRWGLQIQREETTAAKKDLKTFTREQKEFFRSEEFQRDIKPFEEKEISRRDVSETAQGAVKLAAPFGKDGRPTVITVFENADRSVLVHELGRVFLNDIQHFAETTDDLTVAGDWAAARQWLKVEEGQPLTMEQHEKFARGFEKFLRSGKAPVPRLQNLFNQFREWLKSVYTNAAQLDVSISPSAQSMFDGLFLTDNERIALHSIDVPQSDYDLMRNNASMKITGDTYLKEKGLKVKDSNTILRNVFVPISTRLLQINKELFHSIRKFDFNIGIFKDKQMKILTPFFDKVKKLSADDYLDLDYALKNRDTNKILEIAKRNGMEKELKTIKDLLETTRKEALAVGMEVNVIENYFPRKVLDSSKYLTFLQGTTEWNLIERQLIKAGLEHADPVIRADFINNQMAEFNFKEERQLARESTDPRARRTVQFIDPQKNAFYADSFSALTSYIGAMTNMIQMRRFWNVDSNNISESVGGIVAKLVKEGKINFAQEAELKVILRARFEQVGTTGWVAHYKNIEYISTMGNPASAITQIGDLALAAYGNGLLTSLGALTSSIRGKQRVTKEDLGIQQIAVEFTNESTSQKAVTAVFKAVGLSTIDNIGKETVINGALTKLGKKARSRDKQFEQDVHDIFGTEAKQTLKDLRDETISDNVKYLLFSELSNLQPISLSEMPVSYLRGGNLRIFYMLKTYTIKVLDIYNRDVLMEMHTNPKKALGNFIRLSSALLIMGATADELKNLLLGRAADLSDLVIDNILKLMGFSKYSIYKARREGAGSAAAALLLPPFSLVNATTMDTFDVIFKDDFDITKARTLARLPVVGKLYDWWFGRAAERKEKKKGQKSAFAL